MNIIRCTFGIISTSKLQELSRNIYSSCFALSVEINHLKTFPRHGYTIIHLNSPLWRHARTLHLFLPNLLPLCLKNIIFELQPDHDPFIRWVKLYMIYRTCLTGFHNIISYLMYMPLNKTTSIEYKLGYYKFLHQKDWYVYSLSLNHLCSHMTYQWNLWNEVMLRHYEVLVYIKPFLLPVRSALFYIL